MDHHIKEMGQFDADRVLNEILQQNESYFLVAQSKDNTSPYIIDECGVPLVRGTFAEAEQEMKEYLSYRSDLDFEVKIKKISLSTVGRGTTRETAYTLEDGLVEGVQFIQAAYRADVNVVREYEELDDKGVEGDEDSSRKADKDSSREAKRIFSFLDDEFNMELKAILAQFPSFPHYGVKFGDPTIVYLAQSEDQLDKEEAAGLESELETIKGYPMHFTGKR